jgi:hypothetical protein
MASAEAAWWFAGLGRMEASRSHVPDYVMNVRGVLPARLKERNVPEEGVRS